MLKGGCFCGALRYETAEAASEETLCHCTFCRRVTGAPAVAWYTVRQDEFRWVKGAPARFRSSKRAARTFCRRCGTQLTFQRDDLPDEIDVTICSLDEPERIPPKDHTHTASRVPWLNLGDLPER